MPLWAQEKFVCVWRNPERTMTRLFPDAQDYKTKIVPITAEKLSVIEKRIGTEILAGQRKQYQYFEMLNKNGEVIGYTMAVTQKGQFGAIELVFGLDKNHSLNGIYIQRSRERNNEFKKPAFLEKLKGVNFKTIQSFKDPLGDKSNAGSMAVVNGVRKEMIALEELVLKK